MIRGRPPRATAVALLEAPTGIAWETFRTLGSIPVYGEDTAVFDHGTSIAPVENSSAQCCVPAQRAAPEESCCAK
jgi:hypothetical protein